MGSFPAIFAPSPFGDAQTVFNPARYYAEQSADMNLAPGSPATTPAPVALRTLYLPMLAVVAGIWLLERRRLGISFGARASAAARA